MRPEVTVWVFVPIAEAVRLVVSLGVRDAVCDREQVAELLCECTCELVEDSEGI